MQPTRWTGAGNIGSSPAHPHLSTRFPLTLRQSSVFSGVGPGWTRQLFLPNEESTPVRPLPPANLELSTLRTEVLPDATKPANVSARSVAFKLHVDQDVQVCQLPDENLSGTGRLIISRTQETNPLQDKVRRRLELDPYLFPNRRHRLKGKGLTSVNGETSISTRGT